MSCQLIDENDKRKTLVSLEKRFYGCICIRKEYLVKFTSGGGGASSLVEARQPLCSNFLNIFNPPSFHFTIAHANSRSLEFTDTIHKSFLNTTRMARRSTSTFLELSPIVFCNNFTWYIGENKERKVYNKKTLLLEYNKSPSNNSRKFELLEYPNLTYTKQNLYFM